MKSLIEVEEREKTRNKKGKSEWWFCFQRKSLGRFRRDKTLTNDDEGNKKVNCRRKFSIAFRRPSQFDVFVRLEGAHYSPLDNSLGRAFLTIHYISPVAANNLHSFHESSIDSPRRFDFRGVTKLCSLICLNQLQPTLKYSTHDWFPFILTESFSYSTTFFYFFFISNNQYSFVYFWNVRVFFKREFLQKK